MDESVMPLDKYEESRLYLIRNNQLNDERILWQFDVSFFINFKFFYLNKYIFTKKYNEKKIILITNYLNSYIIQFIPFQSDI